MKPAKKKKPSLSLPRDLLWKGIIEELFEDVLHFFYPNFVDEIDFTQPYEFLDKELQKLTPEADSRNRRADMLVKVFLKNGEEQWLLIHIEVQGYRDDDFPLRMYIYNYRSFDRFNKNVVGLAILTDNDATFRPTYYERKRWSSVVRYDFETYKLLDYEEADFEKSKNPFAAVMQIARNALDNEGLKSDQDLLDLKLKLFREMLTKGHKKHIIREIVNFINHYVSFQKTEFYDKFEEEVFFLTKNETNMTLTELIQKERIKVAKAEGIEEGKVETILKERRKTVTKLLSKGFSVDDIIEMLDYSKEEVEAIYLELQVEKMLKKGIVNDEIIKMLEVSEEFISKIEALIEKED